jgi:hypothetical protein
VANIVVIGVGKLMRRNVRRWRKSGAEHKTDLHRWQAARTLGKHRLTRYALQAKGVTVIFDGNAGT